MSDFIGMATCPKCGWKCLPYEKHFCPDQIAQELADKHLKKLQKIMRKHFPKANTSDTSSPQEAG